MEKDRRIGLPANLYRRPFGYLGSYGDFSGRAVNAKRPHEDAQDSDG